MNRKMQHSPGGRKKQQRPPAPAAATPDAAQRGVALSFALAAVAVVASLVWSYWPSLVILVETWNREPDYSHGFLVVPLALYFLWARRDRFPQFAPTFAWPGLLLLLLSVVVRIGCARYYVDSIDGWSMILWIGGAVWLVGGWPVIRWSWPAIVFLLFMVPLPWRTEHLLSYPLQRVATKLSCAMMQCLDQPAIAEGNTIWLNDARLEVEQACSGLRIFTAIVALCFAYLILFPRPWWQRVCLVLSIAPVALVANAARITATGLIGQYVSGEAAQRFTHDVSGWVMIPFAAALFALVLWFLGHLVREMEVVEIRELLPSND
jgi:exosortase